VRIVVSGKEFCHTGSESCFGYCDPARSSLKSLQTLIKNRISDSENSYTANMLKDKYKIMSKIIEESEELVCAKGEDEITHETADLLYFMMLNLEKNNVDVQHVENELIKRRYNIIKDRQDIIVSGQEKFKIGVMLANTPKEFVFEYLEKIFDTKIMKAKDSDRSLKYDTTRKDIMIIPVKPKDVAVLINNKFIDAVVSYEDIILNYSINVMKVGIKKNITKSINIVIAVKEGIDIETLKEMNKNKKLVIMAEYVKLTSDWVRKNNLSAKIVHVSGSSESYLVNDLCDACVVVYDTGETLRQNNLKVLDTLVTSSVNLFVEPTKIDMLYKIIEN
jgi:ATP phosphoribosyltransferase